MKKKVIIVGGVAGGATAAARLRRLDEEIEMIMFERGEYISFANCGLPYYIGGSIKERSALLVQTPEAMGKRFNLDIRTFQEVTEIKRAEKKVVIKHVNTGVIYEESYDELILSPGSSPLKPPIPGINHPNIYTLWTIPDTDKIKDFIDEKKPKKAAVIGGGFIGLEMAENLAERGIEVTLIELMDQVMAPIDFEMAQMVHQHMLEKGVYLYLGDGVKQFDDNHGGVKMTLNSGKVVEADMVMLSIGVRPNSELAIQAGLEVNERKGIKVDQFLKTSDPSIYAIGDVIGVEDFVTKNSAMIPLAGPANKQGRIVANQIVGKKDSYKGTQGTSIAKVFDLTVGATGVNEKTLIRDGKVYNKDYFITIVQQKSHAGYYPGALPMTLKVLFDKNGKVLGAQNVGYDGVDKRIDVLATVIRYGGTIYELKDLELAYAPPFSSAKDPVNMVGYTAENILTGDCKVMTWKEIKELDPNGVTILDVREPIERELGMIPHSINIPVDEIRERHFEIDKRKPVIVYCAVGIRGYVAQRMLKQFGFDAINYLGGFSHYQCVFGKKDFTTQEYSGCCMNKIEIEDSGDIKGESLTTITLDACGLQCPGPILQVFKKMEQIKDGEILEVLATDPGFTKDAAAWCKKTGNSFLKAEKRDKTYVAFIKKGLSATAHPQTSTLQPAKDGHTMVVFSGDLDKALATFIIANGAAAMGKKVTLFFTFWGLNILRKSEKVPVKKTLIDGMFGKLMPRGASKLTLSKMNMGGAGTKMMKHVMKKKNVESLENLIESAHQNGVKMVACTMSMDIMGITKEELIDGLDYAGVASYLGDAEEASVNLFV